MEDTNRTRNLGTASKEIKDDYADGKAAKIWEKFIGEGNTRNAVYKEYLLNLLKTKGCKRILDAACGTGVDSIMLIEEGFEVVSVDASDKMLKYALRTRWNRRKEPLFDDWIIEEGNWITLYDDIKHLIRDGFDAVICLGNSFVHLIDPFGDQRQQKEAIRNFERCLKPGGFLLIDHRNFDYIIKNGCVPRNSLYYNFHYDIDMQPTVLYVAGKPSVVQMDYSVDIVDDSNPCNNGISEFRFSFYPHNFKDFEKLLKEIFGSKANYKVYGDFEELTESVVPTFFMHLIQKEV